MGQRSVAIMQPYFLPYIGYWQLMNSVDTFVIYDNIEYTKKSWINRNRYLLNGAAEFFTLPLKKDSDYLHVCERRLSDDFSKEREKIIRRWKAAYRGAPYYSSVMPVAEEALSSISVNLFDFIYHSIRVLRDCLGISNQLLVSSEIDVCTDHKGQEKVIAICNALGASDYVNPIGGVALYSKDVFRANGVKLRFQQVRNVIYPQSGMPFVPSLSIIDVLMFCGPDRTRGLLTEMDLC